MLSHTTTHVSDGLAKLVEQLKGKPKLTALVTALLSQVQDVEDALWQLYTLRSILTATGKALDAIGRIVGEPRGNAPDDDQYRKRILARIRTNLSSGTVNDLHRVFDCFTLNTKIERQPPAGFSLRILDAVTASDAVLYFGFMLEAKAAGIKAVMEWIESAPSVIFTCAVSTSTTTFVDSDVPIALPVQSTAFFPNSGSLVLDYGVIGSQETVSYTSKDATNFYGVGTTVEHAQGATVTCVAASLGLGFGDSTNASIGGKLAGAASGN